MQLNNSQTVHERSDKYKQWNVNPRTEWNVFLMKRMRVWIREGQPWSDVGWPQRDRRNQTHPVTLSSDLNDQKLTASLLALFLNVFIFSIFFILEDSPSSYNRLNFRPRNRWPNIIFFLTSKQKWIWKIPQ